MNPIQSYLSSLQKNKPTYSSLSSANAQSSPLNKFLNPTPKPKVFTETPTPLVSNTPSSTAPVATPKPTTPVSTTPKQQYMNTVATPTPNYAQPGYKSPGQIADDAEVAKKTSSSDSNSALAEYLSMYAGSDLMAQRKKLADIQNEGEAKKLAGRRASEAKLDEPGMLKAGAEVASGQIERRTNQELADLAVQESGASRSLSAITEGLKPLQIGDSYIDPTTGKVIYSKPQAGFSVGKDQQRYEIDPETGQYKLVASGVSSGSGSGSGLGGGTYVAGANPTVDSWANRIQEGSAKITDIPASQASLRNAVTVALSAMGNNPEGKPTTTELGKTALTTAKDLLAKFDKGEGTSAVGKSGFLGSLGYSLIPGTARANLVTDFNALKSLLSLDGVKYLKGQGQVSDAERALLAQAVTKLNLAQSEAEFKATLQNIIKKLDSGIIEGTENVGGNVLTSPDGSQEVDVTELTPEELKEAQDAGWQ